MECVVGIAVRGSAWFVEEREDCDKALGRRRQRGNGTCVSGLLQRDRVRAGVGRGEQQSVSWSLATLGTSRWRLRDCDWGGYAHC